VPCDERTDDEIVLKHWTKINLRSLNQALCEKANCVIIPRVS
jgi:hypothetical protein